MADNAIFPKILFATAVMSLLVTVDGHSKLKPVVFVVGDLRVVRKSNVADGNGGDSLRSQPSRKDSFHLRHRFVRNVNLKTHGLQRLKPKVSWDEAVTVCIDQVTGDVLSKSERRMAS
jgi:hypothetical protein